MNNTAKLMRLLKVSTPDKLLDALQDRGLVSDNCARLNEVAECDLRNALEILEREAMARSFSEGEEL